MRGLADAEGRVDMYCGVVVAFRCCKVLDGDRMARYGDAIAALGIINGSGLGKMRNTDAGLLWTQRVTVEQRFTYGNAVGANHPADLFTNYSGEMTNAQHTGRLGSQVVGGPPGNAIYLHILTVSMDDCQTGGDSQQWKWLHDSCDRCRKQVLATFVGGSYPWVFCGVIFELLSSCNLF